LVSLIASLPRHAGEISTLAEWGYVYGMRPVDVALFGATTHGSMIFPGSRAWLDNFVFTGQIWQN
jgi:hypothetical protein